MLQLAHNKDLVPGIVTVQFNTQSGKGLRYQWVEKVLDHAAADQQTLPPLQVDYFSSRVRPAIDDDGTKYYLFIYRVSRHSF